MKRNRPLSLSIRPDAEGTGTRLLALLREGSWTVEDLAQRLDLTDNAVRFHLAGFEREGIVRREGVRRGPAAGQPASLYSLTSVAEESFSRAYAPVLSAVLAELHESMSTSQIIAFLKRVGKRIGRGGRSAAALPARVAEASEMLNSLGGITVVKKDSDGYHIVGRACPLARAVESDHCVCTAVTALVAEIVDADVRERCDRSGRPHCCFQITPRRVSS